jgi:hypothetical protein
VIARGTGPSAPGLGARHGPHAPRGLGRDRDAAIAARAAAAPAIDGFAP